MSTNGATPAPPLGELLAGRYRLERLIGKGGMAEVFAAHDTELDRRVAIKWLRPSLASDEVVAERFRREASAAASLSHPNIVAVHDVCEHDGRQAVVMQLVDGKSLRKLLDGQKRLGPELTIHIGAGIAAALDEAHRANIVHRDVKPGNILVTSDGRVLLTDFGIAKALSTDHSDLTLENVMMGTAKYLSPEQVRGHRLDGRADLYSLGLVLYECLAGCVPFLGESDADTALARLQRDPTDLGYLRPTLPIGLVNLIHTTLARNPAHRPQNGARLRSALLSVDSEPPRIDHTPTEAPKPRRRAIGAGPGIPGDPHMSGQLPATARDRRPTRPASGHDDAPVAPADDDPADSPGQLVPVTPDDASDPVADRAGRDRTPPAMHPVHGKPARRNDQRNTPLAIGLLAIVAIALIVALILVVVNSRGEEAPDLADVTVQNTAPEAQATPTAAASAPADDGPLSITGTATFDPDGDNGDENGAHSDEALADGSTTTYWFTECYQNEYMGGKAGVGLTIELSKPATGTVQFEVGTAPYQVQVFAADAEQVPNRLDQWNALGEVEYAEQPGTVAVEVGADARHLMVWFTELGADDACSSSNPYRGTVDELTFG